MTDIKNLESGDQVNSGEIRQDLLIPGLADTKGKDDKLNSQEQKLAEQNTGSSRFSTPEEPNNPPVATHGRVQDNDLTNQDGQPLENSPLTTGFTGVAGDSTGKQFGNKNPQLTKDREVATADGHPSDQSMPLHEKFKAVVDRVSGNTVVVRNKNAEVETKELERLMKIAHDSLGDANVSDISTGHPYWGLQEQARRYGKEHGLL